MQAVILAGGLGKRLRPLTEVIPKPLLPIGEESILEVIIGNFVRSGFDRIFIATNYRSELIESYIGDGKKYNIDIAYSRETTPLGTAGPLGLIRDKLDGDFVLTNGDILTNLDFSQLVAWHKKNDFDLTVSTKVFKTPLNYGVIACDGDFVTDIKEKPIIESVVNAGIYCISPACLDLIPRDSAYDMNSFIRKLIQEKFKVGQFQLESHWFDIGQFEDYESAKQWYQGEKQVVSDVE